MYDSFYHLAEKPFKISADPRFLWCGEKHGEALANLSYGLMDDNGFVVLTGDIGTGKTTLVNAFLESLDDRVLVSKINHPSLDTSEFLTLVAKTFDPSVSIHGKSDQLLFFNAFLQQVHAQGKAALLIIDEAHRLSIELLEEIRLLSNIEQEGKRLLNIIFVGQNELKPLLFSPQCRALRQRITLFYEIQALSPQETVQYVEYRLKVSGLEDRLFTPAALRQIHAVSKGNPRLINILCDRALLTGFLKERKKIDADIIFECAREINLRNQTMARIQGLLIPQWLTWKRALFTQSGATMLSVNPMLRRAREWVRGRLLPSLAKIFSKPAMIAIFAIKNTGRFTKQYQRKVITSVLAAGIAVLSLALTIGAYKAADLSSSPSATAKDSATPRRSALTAIRKPTEIVAASRVAPQITVPQTAVSATAGPASAQEASVAGQIPEVQRVKPTLTETAGQQPPAPAERATAALEQKDYQKAIDLFESVQGGIAAAKSETAGLYAKALVGRAGEIMATSPLSAEIMLLKAIEAAPDLAEPYLVLGKHYTRTKDNARAIEAYQKAVRLVPDLSDAFFNLGFIYATSGAFEAAEKAFARVAELKPSYLGKALFNLAVVQQKLGKKEESIANLELATAMAPENKRALAYLNRLRGKNPDNLPKQGT